MKQRIPPALVLYLLSPVIGELLSGSAPPVEFFNPFGLIILPALYGSGALLVREVTLRWQKRWPGCRNTPARLPDPNRTRYGSTRSLHHCRRPRHGMRHHGQWPWLDIKPHGIALPQRYRDKGIRLLSKTTRGIVAVQY